MGQPQSVPAPEKMGQPAEGCEHWFFGLGNDTALPGKSLFGMSQTIVGASAIKPVFELPVVHWLNLALLGEVNGRLVSMRGEQGQSVPSIETLYNDVAAPGLTNQPSVVQLGEGLRIKPAIGNLQLNYTSALAGRSGSIASFDGLGTWMASIWTLPSKCQTSDNRPACWPARAGCGSHPPVAHSAQ